MNFIPENPRHKERRRRQGARPAAPGMAPPGVEEQIRDDVRMLHEAYQFLSRYGSNKSKHCTTQLLISETVVFLRFVL